MLLCVLPLPVTSGMDLNGHINGFNGFYLGDRLRDVIPFLEVKNISYKRLSVAHHTFIDAETVKWKVRLVFNYLGFLYAIHVQVKLEDDHYTRLVSHLDSKYGDHKKNNTEKCQGLQWSTGDRYSMTVNRGDNKMVYIYYIDHLFYRGTLEWEHPVKPSPYDAF